MKNHRPRLLLSPHGPPLTDDQLSLLQEHFEVVHDPEGPQDAVAALAQTPEVDQDLAATIEAGRTLIDLSVEDIRTLNSMQRLKRLEELVTRSMRELLHFDHFEIRLINPKTGQLEMVIACGIEPLEVGQTIFAKPEGNGISGYVSTSGKSYLCRDVPSDRRYTLGIESARSSLTVPLKLGNHTIGVLNVESTRSADFTPADQVRAEVFASYVAIALHTLNLLVAERYSTRASTAHTMSEELGGSLEQIVQAIESARSTGPVTESSETTFDRILEAVADARHGLGLCEAGPSSLLGVDRTTQRQEPIPEINDRHVVVVDDDDAILSNVEAVLERAGCRVTTFSDGKTAIDWLESHIDLVEAVVSDVKLPDFTGYEIFRTVRRHNSDLPIILMTGFGYDPHHSIVRASQEGLESILFKPFTANQLLDEVKRAFSPA